jgi:hypothetical protein
MMTLANGGRRVPTYMHPDMFASRAVKANDGRLMPMEDIPSEHALAANGADLIIARNEQSVLSNTVFISGEIPRVTSFEKGMPGQHRLDAAGEWPPDELLVDERFVAVHLANNWGDPRQGDRIAQRPPGRPQGPANAGQAGPLERQETPFIGLHLRHGRPFR